MPTAVRKGRKPASKPATTTPTMPPYMGYVVGATTTWAPTFVATPTTPSGPPAGWPGGTYSNTAFVRYSRRLKANGHYVVAYRVYAATTPAHKAVVATMPAGCQQATFAVHNATTGVWAGFATWAPAYAYSMAQAPSVVASLGQAGLASVGLAGLTRRAAPATTPATPTGPVA
jgi:hypothetical protein